MRETTYTCDKCGLKMGAKTAARVSVTIAEGSNAPLKRPYDFCPACFSGVKEMFSRYLHAKKGGETDGTATRFAEVPMVNGPCSFALPSCGSLCIDSPEDSASKPLFGDQEKPKDAETSEGISTVLDDVPFSEECKALCGSIDNEANPSEGEIKGQDAEHAQPAKLDAEGNFCEGEKGNLSEISCKESDGPESGESCHIARHGGECSLPKESSEESCEPTVFGPISPSEKERIFKLHLVDGLSEVEIAKRLGRLPRGVKRAINTAKATGELESLRRIFREDEPEGDERMSGKAYEAAKEEPGDGAFHDDGDESLDNELSIKEDCRGSGATNAGIYPDAYTGAPLTEVVDGKRYDVGGILALARAGWPIQEIAREKNYKKDVVEMICMKYRCGL